MAIMSLIGVFALFIPLDGLIGNSDTLPRKIIETIFLLFALYVVTHIVVFSIFRIIGKISRKILVAPLNNGKKMFILFGDILNSKVISKKEISNIVIPFNRCFDTRIDNSLISDKSLHGHVVKELINSGKYSEKSLHQEIAKSLSRPWRDQYVPEIVDKEIGYKKRYPVGAVALINGIHSERYLFLGLSKFNQETAEMTRREYVDAIEHLAERIADISQGYPVYMPLIGNGLSRIGINDKLALKTILNMIDLNRQNICSDIYIVINPKLKESLFSIIENYE